MTDEPFAPAPSRQAGRSLLLLAFFLAVLICGATIGYFLYFHGGEDVVEEGVPELVVEEPVPAPAPLPATEPSPGGAEVVTPPVDDSGVSREPALAAELRVHGTVTDSEGRALPGIHVRWIPAPLEQLGPCRQDGNVLGKESDLERVPAGALRSALASSLATTSGDDGAYELRVPIREEPSTVIALGSGYELGAESVRNGMVERRAPTSSAKVAIPEEEPTTQEEPGDVREVRIDFRLGVASSISGKVTDIESGEPAAGMVVVASSAPRDRPAILTLGRDRVESGSRAVVGPDGTYSIVGVPPGEYVVVPRSGTSAYVSLGSSQGKKLVIVGGEDAPGIDFQVGRGGVIRGRAEGPDGELLEGVKCVVLPENFMSRAVSGDLESVFLLEKKGSRTGADGLFEFRGLALGESYRVTGEVDDLAPAISESVEITAEEPEAEVVLSMSAGWSISGHVRGPDGSVAPDVEVGIVPDFGQLMSGNLHSVLGGDKKDRTDEEGAFQLRHLTRGEYDLYAGALDPQDILTGKKGAVRVVIDGSGDVTGIEITLKSREGKGAIAGIVVDDLGRPVAGATVKVAGLFEFVRTQNTQSREDGSFVFNEVTGDGPFRVSAEKAGHTDASRSGVPLNGPEVTMVLNRHATLHGRIVIPDGSAPPGGGRVWSRLIGESLSSSLQMIQKAAMGLAKNDAVAVAGDGTFRIETSPGQLEVLATVPGFAPARSEAIEVAPGEERSGIEIALSVGAVLHGKVTPPGTAQGLAGATVTVASVEAGEENFFKTMLPQFFENDRNRASSGEEGRWEIRYLAPGKYSLTASHPEYAPSDPLKVTLYRDQVWETRPLVLTVAASISGRVWEADKPRAGVMAQFMGGGPLKQVMTDAEGRFEFTGLRAGDYLVNVLDMASMQKGRMRMKSRPVTLATGEEQELEIVFGTGHRVHGTVKGLGPGPWKQILLHRPGGPRVEDLDPLDMESAVEASKYQAGVGMIGQDGKYEISDVEPGKYLLLIPRMPADPTDLEAYKTMDRTPHFRKEITVEDEDLELNIEVK